MKKILIFILINYCISLSATFSKFVEMQEHTWYQVSNDSSKMNCISYANDGYGNDIENMIGAWNSGAYDPVTHRMYITGGGHNDYYGTEGYYFDLVDLAWRFAWDRNGLNSYGGSCVESVGGIPNQRHTYDGLEFDYIRNRFLEYGGSLACQTGGGSDQFWEWNPTTDTWTNIGGLSDETDTYLGMNSHFSPKDTCFYLHDEHYLYKFDLVGQSVTLISDYHAQSYGRTACIDTSRNWYIACGEGDFWYFDLDESTPLSPHNISSTGGSSIINAQAPGIDFSPIEDKLIGYTGGIIYEMNMTTNVWTTRDLANNPPTSCVGTSTKIYNRWRYMPEYNTFIFVGCPDEDVYFYKSAFASGEWGSRSAQSGVQIAYDFSDSNQVVNHLHRDREDPKWYYTVWDTTLGEGCMRKLVPDDEDLGATNDFKVNFSETATSDTGVTNPAKEYGISGAGNLGSTFYIPFLYRIDSTMSDNVWSLSSGRGGWKQCIFGDGDDYPWQNGDSPEVGSSITTEIVMQNEECRLAPALYHSSGYYTTIDSNINSTSLGTYQDTTNDDYHNGQTWDATFQNAKFNLSGSTLFRKYSLVTAFRDATGEYGESIQYQYYTHPVPTEYPVWSFVPNEWMAFLIRIDLGPLGTAHSYIMDDSNNYSGWTYSRIRFYAGHQDASDWTKLVDIDSTVLIRDDGATPSSEGYGKIWLTDYHTGLLADANGRNDGLIWYDELIVSDDSIAFPFFYGLSTSGTTGNGNGGGSTFVGHTTGGGTGYTTANGMGTMKP